MRLVQLLVALFLGAVTTSAAALLPSRDSFYTPPADLEKYSPGEIIDYRHSPYSYAEPLPHYIDEAYQVLYRTTDTFGNAQAAVTTILIPPNANLEQIISHQAIQNSASVDCSPSYILGPGADQHNVAGTSLETFQRLFIAGALNQGRVVIVPDHEGLNAAFLANRHGAHIILDAIRAATSSGHFTGISPDAAAAINGYSGGSLATGLAAELQPIYAPDVKLRGVAVGGIFPRMEVIVDAEQNGGYECSLPAGLWGLAAEYPELSLMIEKSLSDNPEVRKGFEATRNLCFGVLCSGQYNTPSLSSFKSLDFLNSTLVQRIFETNDFGQNVPAVPVLLYQTRQEMDSTIHDTKTLIRKYCEGGTVVEYRRVFVESHQDLGIDGLGQAIVWLMDRLDGFSGPTECTETKHISEMDDPRTLEFFGESAAAELKRLLGKLADLPQSTQESLF